MTPTIGPIAVTTGAITGFVLRDAGGGVVSMTSNDPWYRLFRALADLFITGEIDAQRLSDGFQHDHPEKLACPAAQHMLRSIYLAIDEPNCLCDPYKGRCQCPPSDRRERLRELIGA